MIRFAAALLCAAFAFSGCARQSESVSSRGFAMGSLIEASVYPAGALPDGFFGELFAAASGVDSRLSATDPASETARLNETGAADCSPETAELLRTSLALCNALGGRLDITLGAVTELWGFSGEEPRVPSPGDIASALLSKGTDKVVFSGNRVALGPGQRLDLGAVGKGAGCDAMRSVIEKYDLPAVVNFGGTVMLCGTKPGGGPWKVGLRDPGGAASDWCAVLSLRPEEDGGACFVSTSGSYEKAFTENGKTYHHILDPETGRPVETPLSAVTAVGKNGLVCDALSTALFVNGCNETSLRWVGTYLTGAVFVFSDGGVFVTDGLRDVFELTDTARFALLDADGAMKK